MEGIVKWTRILRQNSGALLRLLFCALVFWAFTVGSYSGPITIQAALTLSTMLSLLATYELTIRDVRPEWVLGALFIPLLVILGAYSLWLSVQPPPPTGALVPAGEKSPPLTCAQKPGPHDLVMQFGTDTVIGRGGGPYTPIIVGDCPVLFLVRRGNRLMVNSFGYDQNNDIGFRIKDNLFQSMPGAGMLRVLRPDSSTFVLLNGYDEEVLYVRYLSVNAVRIRGHFLCGDAPQIVIHDKVISAGGAFLRGGMIGAHAIPGHACAVTDPQNPHGIAFGAPVGGAQ